MWKAARWIAAAHPLADLPRIGQALVTGRLGLDKVVELTRFATAETETSLIRWADGQFALEPTGDVEWFRPGGTRYRADPAPPTQLPLAV